jgi:arylsulfatase A-like enzyme
VLRLNGYSTAMFGKHHNVPGDERSEAGPFDAWPTGLGFDYFFGFPYGDSDQFSPQLYRGVHVSTSRTPARVGDKLLDTRLADDLIRWVHNQKAGAPDKPFLVYWAPGSTHAPHQAPPEYIARFKGSFDQGWDACARRRFRRQLRRGRDAQGTKLSAAARRASRLGQPFAAAQKPFAARTMEVAAAQLAYQDEQIGRVLDELARMGELDQYARRGRRGRQRRQRRSRAQGHDQRTARHGHDDDEAWMLEGHRQARRAGDLPEAIRSAGPGR